MKTHLRAFKEFLNEAEDPTYYQETFYFTILLSLNKEVGGSRDETKNDIRALPEILTVTLVEPEEGGIQKDLGTKYLSTLKIHIRKPKDINKQLLMRRAAAEVSALRGCSVLRFKERKPKQHARPFQRAHKMTEGDYYQSAQHMKDVQQDAEELTSKGPQTTGGGSYKTKNTRRGPWGSSPPGAPGGLEEAQLDEVMKTAADLPEGVVVVVRRVTAPEGFAGEPVSFKVYFALGDSPKRPLKSDSGFSGVLMISAGRNEPYDGVYIVTSAKAKDNFGPLLYDVALEVAGKAGLKPDTDGVSDDANAVWKYYDTRREDVDAEMLVADPDEYSLVMPYERAENPEANQHLAKVYFKKDKATIQQLTKQGKFVELSPGDDVPAPSGRQELTDLAAELNIPIVSRSTDLRRFDRLREDILISVGAPEGFMAFDIQSDLNQKIWEGDTVVRPGVKGALMDIVEEFMEGLELEIDVKDITITGSLANYNWSKYSDIDIHILVDFAEINDNEQMVKKFFDAVRSRWNKVHDITVKGHEVEIYVQDAHEPHTSTGVYSLLNDEWVVKPKKIKPEIDAAAAEKKMVSLAKEITKLAALGANGRAAEALKMAERIKDKIGRMRKSGLEKSGIYSPENLAFKMLRRSGDIEKLFNIYTRAYDTVYSLDQ
tara:strand:- start:1108 stop:3081 length:1974 start_codon:yes stop_codon:yes gene_type:complete